MNLTLLVIGLLVLAGLGFGAYEQGRADGRAHERAKSAEQIARLQKDNSDHDRDYRLQAGQLEEARHQIENLLTFRAPQKGLTSEKPTNAPVTSCPDRSELYLSLYNDIATHRGAAPPVPGPVPAAPGDHPNLHPPGLVEKRGP